MTEEWKYNPDEKEKVDADEFNTSASDQKGHSTRLYVRCQKGIAMQIQMILTTRHFPYRTQGDLIRHALLRHLKWLNRALPIGGTLTQVEVINKVLDQEENAASFSGVFENMSRLISMYQSQGDTREAVRLVRTVQDLVKKMGDGYWKDKYAKEIKHRWAHLIKEVGGVSLAESEEE